MSKTLTARDFAPFIGCDVVFDEPNATLNSVSFSPETAEIRFYSIKDGVPIGPAYHAVSIDKVKPILRPLDSITEQENLEAKKTHFESLKVNEPGSIQHFAAMTDWFIRQDFDVHGWIKQGLAIKKENA